MRIKAEQLAAALKKKLAPVYLVCGDEPMQMGEAADMIRLAAKQEGYINREILEVEGQSSWAKLAINANSLSLFDDKKVLDLRLPSGKPGGEGSKALIAYCQDLSEDNLLLITAGKIPPASQKSRWFQALDKAGAIVQVWPQEGQQLLQWLQRRIMSKGLQLDEQGIKLLAAETEGNLLAASQEIEKLFILNGAGKIDYETVAAMVTDNSRYDVFKLVDCILSADVQRINRILPALKAEGIAEPVVLWALTREARTLFKIKMQLAHGINRDSVFKQHNIWEKRKHLISTALKRTTQDQLQQVLLLAAKIDRQIKGQQQGDAWVTIFQCCLLFAGSEMIPVDSLLDYHLR